MKAPRNADLIPSDLYFRLNLPDETPAIVILHALDEKQLLLARVRHNRLIDRFFNVIATPIQTAWRSAGKVEIDEIDVATSNSGKRFAVMVDADSGMMSRSVVALRREFAACKKAFPSLTARSVAVQFLRDASDEETIVMFELVETDDGIAVVDQKHYRLVPAKQIGSDDLERYRRSLSV